MKQARLKELLAGANPSLSYEVFPPKTSKGVTALMGHLAALSVYRPDFISVTYGAGGSTRDRSIEVLERICTETTSAVLAHFTCVGMNRQTIDEFVERLRDLKVENILALRGDPPRDQPDFDFSQSEFRYARDLVAYLVEKYHFSIGVAGYPEGHLEASSKEEDWDHLKAKVDAGAECVVTQLFFDNDHFYRFRDHLKKKGVEVPLIPGLLPVASMDRLNKIVNLSGSKISPEFQRICDSCGNDPDAFLAASVEFSQKQIEDLLAKGAPGIHLYILNQSEIILRVLEKGPFAARRA